VRTWIDISMHDIWNLLSTPLDQKERGVMKITTLLISFFYYAFPD
jgi:hypothetical protein